MKKYAKITNEITKQCEVGIGTNDEFYKSIGMTLQEVEQGYDGNWYVLGFAPTAPLKSLEELKAEKIAELKNKRDEFKKANNYDNPNTVDNILIGLGNYTDEERLACKTFFNNLITKYDTIKDLINNATLDTINTIPITFED